MNHGYIQYKVYFLIWSCDEVRLTDKTCICNVNLYAICSLTYNHHLNQFSKFKLQVIVFKISFRE